MTLTANVDSSQQTAKFLPGTRVLVLPNQMMATVVKQYLQYNGPESYWGNVLLEYDDGIRGTSNSWQLKCLDNKTLKCINNFKQDYNF